MNSRNVVRLFMTTLLIGGLTSGVSGMVVRWSDYQHYFTSFNLPAILTTFLFLFGLGLIFSVISQAGFFAYLTVHRFGLGIFKNLWNPVQVLIILFVLFDLVYFRYTNFGQGEAITPFIIPALFILVVGGIVAYFKVKQSDNQTFIPAFFFMVVATIIEWTPALRNNDKSWLYFMLFPLLVCNTYQLLVLKKLINRSQQELTAKRNSSQMKRNQSKGESVLKG